MSRRTRALLDVVAGSLLSVVGFAAVGFGHDFLRQAGITIPWGGDKGSVLWALFLGLPAGSALGVWGAERLAGRFRHPDLKGLYVGAVPAMASVLAGVFLMDRVGVATAAALPVIVSVCFTAGLRFHRRPPEERDT